MALLQGIGKFARFPGLGNKFACYAARNNVARRNIRKLQGASLEKTPLRTLPAAHHSYELDTQPPQPKGCALCSPDNPVSLLDAHIHLPCLIWVYLLVKPRSYIEPEHKRV